MDRLKIPRRLSARQCLALDAAGSLLAGCGIFWRTVSSMESEPASRFEDLMNLYVFLLYLIPVCLLLGLAALLLWVALGERGEKPSRVLAVFGAVPQVLVGLIHFGLWEGSRDALLNGLAALVVCAGAAGIFWALFSSRDKS